MKDYKNDNDSYRKMAGVAAGKLMKNHGNTQEVKADNQKQDMGRMQLRGMEKRGYSDKAFEYKY